MPNPEPSSSGFHLVRRSALLGELALVAGVAIAALLFQSKLPSRLPTDEQYRAMAAALASEARPGDALLLYPWWTERARLFAPPSVSVVGYLGSDRDPLTSFPRIWVLAQPNLPRSDLSAFQRDFHPGRSRLGERRVFGNLELTLYRNDLYRPVLFSAVSALASARVYLEAPGSARVECPYDGSAHRCPGSEHLRVAAEWHEVMFQPRYCLWMRPPGGTRRLVAEFPDLPIGDRLVLQAGIIWEYSTRTDPSLTTTRVAVEDVSGGELLRVSIPRGVEGEVRAERSGSSLYSTRGAKLWIQSDNPAMRDTCVELTSDRAPGGTG
ncbi:MAG TPA: hypothetical protein VKE49_10635 [Myxococcaceae bacterium]|nr:hypothetical protein [Myxococcaceae bacterium]